MASFEVLKSAVHGFCHSFMSGGNYIEGPNVIVCHELQRLMRKHGVLGAEIDFIKATIEPGSLLSEPVRLSLDQYSAEVLDRTLELRGCRREDLWSVKIYLCAQRGRFFGLRRVVRFSSAYELIASTGRRFRGALDSFFDGATSWTAVPLVKNFFVFPSGDPGPCSSEPDD